MDLWQVIEENKNLIIANPAPFFATFIITAGGVWVYAKHHYTERIESLKEKISLRDDQIKYQKTLAETKTPPIASSPVIIPTQDATGLPNTIQINVKPQSPKVTTNNLKDDILQEIRYLNQHTGKALSVKLFDRLTPQYSFVVILSEILLMNKNKELTWAEAPSPPDALSEIIITE